MATAKNTKANSKPKTATNLDNEHIHGLDDMLAKLAALKDYLQNDVGEVVGTEAVNHFKQNFENESFSGGQKWAPRKTKREGSTNGQKVLTKSSELTESIDYEADGPRVIIKTDKAYAQIHNEGGTITVTPRMKKYFWAKHKEAKDNGQTDLADQYKGMALAKQLTMPKRQFIGESPALIEAITAAITYDLNRIFQ